MKLRDLLRALDPDIANYSEFFFYSHDMEPTKHIQVSGRDMTTEDVIAAFGHCVVQRICFNDMDGLEIYLKNFITVED